MKAKALTGGLVALTIVAVLATMAVGPVAAETVALPQNETFDVDNETEAIRAVADNASGELTVDVYDVNATSGNETHIKDGTLNATDAAGGTDTYRFEAIPENASQIKLSVDGDGVAVESLALEKVQIVGGGGMLPGDSDGPIVLVVGIVAIVGGLVALSRRD